MEQLKAQENVIRAGTFGGLKMTTSPTKEKFFTPFFERRFQQDQIGKLHYDVQLRSE